MTSHVGARRDFTVVVPAFNEAPVVPVLVKELRAAFEEHALEGEVILVDDGSTDRTAEIAEEAAGDWDAFVDCFANGLGEDDVLVMPEPVCYGGTVERKVTAEDVVRIRVFLADRGDVAPVCAILERTFEHISCCKWIRLNDTDGDRNQMISPAATMISAPRIVPRSGS